MIDLKILKKNKLLIGVLLIYAILSITMKDKAIMSAKNSMYYIIEMIEIMPVIFILTSLIETWVPKDVIMKGFGSNSGIKGGILSFLLGSFSAGPIYAAFPVCKMLLKKGASIGNIVIILSTWAVVKVPMLANEAKFLGSKFMFVRWLLTTIFIFIMAYIVSIIVKKDSIPMQSVSRQQNNEITINRDYCIGCGLCAKLSENFHMVNGKAEVKSNIINQQTEEKILKAVEKCPIKIIQYGKYE